MNTLAKSLIGIIIVVNCIGKVVNYRPVAIIHGLLDVKSSMDFLAAYIQEKHPGTVVKSFDILHGYESLEPIWKQVNKFGQLLYKFNNGTEDGIHLIGYSQGGVVSRGILCALVHKVHTFISLSSPQMGQFGDTDYLRLLFPNYVRTNLYKFFYSRIGQKFSVANYWKDPHQLELYRNYSAYLAVINNETVNPDSLAFKDNFLRLKKLVLIGGPDDGVITPWQSSHFAFFDENEKVVNMTNQEVYMKDSFGLRTLDKRHAIVSHSIPGVSHLEWHMNSTIFDNYILPYLD